LGIGSKKGRLPDPSGHRPFSWRVASLRRHPRGRPAARSRSPSPNNALPGRNVPRPTPSLALIVGLIPGPGGHCSRAGVRPPRSPRPCARHGPGSRQGPTNFQLSNQEKLRRGGSFPARQGGREERPRSSLLLPSARLSLAARDRVAAGGGPLRGYREAGRVRRVSNYASQVSEFPRQVNRKNRSLLRPPLCRRKLLSGKDQRQATRPATPRPTPVESSLADTWRPMRDLQPPAGL
jgi:hypothetical protein